ncbi:unnamed protein product [Prorocentrum cordatum]|uniref:Uncharacterized protein n=1 Tax=Prorocentrum cordatum TaxID=2364126 RepID=A0ABN9Q806_9DINO|nr:unnamed protein product [Polarella glacialis]
MPQTSGVAEHAAIMMGCWHSCDRASRGIHVDYVTPLKAPRDPGWALPGASPMAHMWRDPLVKVNAHQDEDSISDAETRVYCKGHTLADYYAGRAARSHAISEGTPAP